MVKKSLKKDRNNTLKPDEMRQFIEMSGNLAGAGVIFNEGLKYVDSANFWQWMHDSAVKKDELFGSAEAIKNFVETKPLGARGLIQGRGAEWDWVKNYNDNPLNMLRGRIARLANSHEDYHGADAIIKDLFGDPTKVQIKTSMSDAGIRVNLSKYDENTRLIVNERIAKWREEHGALLKARGDARPVEQGFTDAKLQKATDRRMEQAKTGEATPGITVQGVLEEVGKGAVIGAVVGVGVSAVSNFKRYKNGEISESDYLDLMMKDSAKGALTGGALSAVNIVVQYSASIIGVGLPVTIPVMLVFGFGIRSIINPIFKEGAYKEVLDEMMYTQDILRGYSVFAINSLASFEIQRHYISEYNNYISRAKKLDKYEMQLDAYCESKLVEDTQ